MIYVLKNWRCYLHVITGCMHSLRFFVRRHRLPSFSSLRKDINNNMTLHYMQTNKSCGWLIFWFDNFWWMRGLSRSHTEVMRINQLFLFWKCIKVLVNLSCLLTAGNTHRKALINSSFTFSFLVYFYISVQECGTCKNLLTLYLISKTYRSSLNFLRDRYFYNQNYQLVARLI